MVDLEAVGGAATGGLIASTSEKPAGQAGEHHNVCADCGTETVGRFCHNCGNPSHVHRTLLHLGEELLHGVMHFDSRTWRTLPLLAFRPGKLTREWVMGKRARYVSPLAIFLFTVFVMFMLLSYMPRPKAGPVERAVAATELARQNTGPVEVRAATQIVAGGAGRPRVVSSANWKEEVAAAARRGELNFDLGDEKLNEKVRHKLENPDLAIYKLQQTFYKFSFLLIPISIPFVAVLFLGKREVTLYDHGVFVLYSLTFMSLLVMALVFAGRAGDRVESWAFAIAPFIVPAHMFFQLRGAYGLGVFGALWRTLLLLVFAAVALCLFVLAIVWLGLI